MPEALTQLYEDLNKDNLRISRPAKFIFFCGGAIHEDPKKSSSLRHYLLQSRSIGKRLKAEIVLAEKANALYRETSYGDLISFEEDIARISALIFIIAESAGSLAELGAFSSIKTIRDNLAALIQTNHANAESFVRYGPIERILKEDQHRIGVFPWRVTKDGAIVKCSAKPHFSGIVQFINSLLKRTPNEQAFRRDPDSQSFWIILWILHLSNAISITELAEYTEYLTQASLKDIRNRLFCMQLAGWVRQYTYSNKTYWYSTSKHDPFSRYSFIPGVVRDTSRRKAEVAAAIQTALKIPRHVREHVAASKVVRA